MNITDEKQYITLCYISYFLDSIYCQNGNKTHLKDINNITYTHRLTNMDLLYLLYSNNLQTYLLIIHIM